MIRRKSVRPVGFLALVGAAVMVVHACATPLTIGEVKLTPSNLVAVSNLALARTVGSTLTNEPTVRVLDQYDEPLPNTDVSFSASSGTQPTPATVPTKEDGTAAVASWTLPTTVGQVTLTASVPGLPASTNRQFTITLNAGPAAAAAVAPGDPSSNNQTGPVGEALALPPAVRVTDQYGNLISNIAVTFTVATGGGTLNGPTETTANATTDGMGIATLTSWLLGPTPGENTLTATVAGVSGAVTFTATGIIGPAAKIVIAPGSPSSQGQSAIGGSKVAVAPAVLVTDAFDNVKEGVVVRFTVSAGNGKVFTSATDDVGANSVDITTNASGIATSFGWKLGAVGTNSLSVTVPSVSTLAAFTINATGTVGPPAEIEISNQPWGFTRAALNNGGSPKVTVKDAGGNPVPDVGVTWSAVTNSTVSGTLTSTTNATGVATFAGTWTANNLTSGTVMTLRATVTSAPTLVANMNSTIVTAPASMAVSAGGTTQSATVNNTVATAPAVLVRDASSRPVPGFSVNFAVTAGGGSLNGTTATSANVSSDSLGVSRVAWKVGTVAGSNNNTLNASAALTGSPITFAASAVAGAASRIELNSTATQAATPSTAVGTPPSVRVTDEFNNVKSGISVTFATSNGATLSVASPACSGTSCTTTTNASGVASVSSWTVGSSAATYTLTATSTGLTGSPLSFTATVAGNSCDPVSYTMGSTVQGTLTTSDCASTSGGSTWYNDWFTHTTSSATTYYTITMTGPSGAAPSFNPVIRSTVWSGFTWSWQAGSNAPVTARYIVAPGTYPFAASTSVAATTGSYQISSILNPAPPAGCGDYFVTKGITVTHTLDTGCDYTSTQQAATVKSKKYIIALASGATARIRMNSLTTGFDPYLECYDVTSSYSTPVKITNCHDDDSGTVGLNADLTIPPSGTSAANRFILIRATHHTSSSPTAGSYTLIIDP